MTQPKRKAMEVCHELFFAWLDAKNTCAGVRASCPISKEKAYRLSVSFKISCSSHTDPRQVGSVLSPHIRNHRSVSPTGRHRMNVFRSHTELLSFKFLRATSQHYNVDR